MYACMHTSICHVGRSIMQSNNISLDSLNGELINRRTCNDSSIIYASQNNEMLLIKVNAPHACLCHVGRIEHHTMYCPAQYNLPNTCIALEQHALYKRLAWTRDYKHLITINVAAHACMQSNLLLHYIRMYPCMHACTSCSHVI